jgi:hypothetical protein
VLLPFIVAGIENPKGTKGSGVISKLQFPPPHVKLLIVIDIL